jgi:Arc-like DNA binding domain
MPRKPSAVLDYKLRIRESLRRQLAQAAEKHGVSMNAEMVRRLEESFTRESNRSIGENARLIQTSAESIIAATRVLEAKLSGEGAVKADLTSLPAAERARQEREGSGS